MGARRLSHHSYATHHRHTCIGARAGFGDLLIGAGALMCEANGLDPGEHGHMREQMVELITIIEGFFACGVAARVYASQGPGSGDVDAGRRCSRNIGKLLLATQIYDMHRLAHYVSGGLIVALPGPDEDHNPATAAQPRRRAGGPAGRAGDERIEVARLHRGPDRLLPGRLVLGDQPARRRLAGGDEAGDLAQLSGRQTRSSWSSACSTAASLADGAPAHDKPARPLLRHRLRCAGSAAGVR